MKFKPADYYLIGAIVAAVWLLAFFRADQSRTKEYRPVDYRAQISQDDENRQARRADVDRAEMDSAHQQERPRPTSTARARFNFDKAVPMTEPIPVIIVEPKPVATTPVAIAEPIAIAEPVAITEPKPIVIAEPVAIIEPQPVAVAEPVVITEPKPVAVAEPKPAEVAEPVVITEPMPATMAPPEPVVHTQNFVPIERPERYDLTAKVRSQSPPLVLETDANIDQASMKLRDLPEPPTQPEQPIEPEQWQSDTFGRVSYPDGVSGPKSVLMKNKHMKLPGSQLPDSKTNSSNSSAGDFQLPARDNGDFNGGRVSTSDFSLDTTKPQDFDFAFGAVQNDPTPDPKPTLDPYVAQNSKMVRKVNWESIEPDSSLVTAKSLRSHSTKLTRQSSPPEIELRAFEKANQGKALATRGAYFAAKEEFINALTMIAESNDRASASRAYTTSLSEGLTALKESEDFATTPQRRDHSRNLKLVMASHETKVIDPIELDGLSFNRASEIYCQFAQSRIEQAIGQSKSGSAALFYLSRLLSAAPELREAPVGSGDNVKRAILLASITADPANFEAANELGVLFYSEAWYKQAVHWFSVAVQTSGGKQLFWQNLAQSHVQLAKISQVPQEQAEHMRLAQLAGQEVGSAPKLDGTSGSLAGWVSPEQFQRNSAIPAATFNQQQAPVATAQVQAVQQPVNQRRGLTKRIKDWF